MIEARGMIRIRHGDVNDWRGGKNDGCGRMSSWHGRMSSRQGQEGGGSESEVIEI